MDTDSLELSALADAAVGFHSKQPSLWTVVRKGKTSRWSPWALCAYNPVDGVDAISPVHNVDVYFWVVEDAHRTLQALRLLGSAVGSLRIDGQEVNVPEREQAEIVQRLESVAISNPASEVTRNAAHPPLTSPSVAVASYNPASPRAPEPLVYREKTPPPADGEADLGAVMRGEAQVDSFSTEHPAYGNLSEPPATESATLQIPGPPMQAPATPPNQFLASFAPPPTAQTNTPQRLQGIFTPPSVSPSPVRALPLRNEDQPKTQYATYGNALPPPPPVVRSATGHTEQGSWSHQHQQSQMYSPSFYAQQQAQAQPTQTYMPSPGLQPGFSPYYQPQTGPSFPHPAPTGPVSPYTIHSQAYRPTEEELAVHGDKDKQSEGLFGALDARAVKVEKGFSKWLGRLDKRL